MVKNKVRLKIFVKDFIVKNNTIDSPKLFSIEGPTKQAHPNIRKVWAEVEAKGAARLLNLLGELGKKDKLEIIEMSKEYDVWDANMIVLGAQASKCIDFYEIMDDVAYTVDEENIYDKETGEVIKREPGYGYGLILKTKNPQMQKEGTGILLGGFGVLGTKAAIYYFVNNIARLGKEFGNNCFGVIVRAKVSAGEQSVKRLPQYDRVYE